MLLSFMRVASALVLFGILFSSTLNDRSNLIYKHSNIFTYTIKIRPFNILLFKFLILK